jgi:hypothetical protein
MNQIDKILQEVRSRLLEFMLELRDVVGIDASNKDLANKASAFDADSAFTKILGHATFGPGATVFIGNQNTQVNVTNKKRRYRRSARGVREEWNSQATTR